MKHNLLAFATKHPQSQLFRERANQNGTLFVHTNAILKHNDQRQTTHVLILNLNVSQKYFFLDVEGF